MNRYASRQGRCEGKMASKRNPCVRAWWKWEIVSSDEALDAMTRTERLCFYALRHSVILQALENGMPCIITLYNDQEEKSGVQLWNFRRVDSLGAIGEKGDNAGNQVP